MSSLQGKVAWVTGAGTGIGLAGARALARAGATVVLSGRRSEVLARQAELIRANAGLADVEVLDVGDMAAVQQVSDAILARHGRIDLLVNSAGLNTPKRTWQDQTPAGWHEVIRANLNGSFHTVSAVLPAMRRQQGGTIVNVSSWAGVHHPKFTGAAYNASKHAVTAMTETINMEEGCRGIRACSLCPGEVDTPILDRRPVPPPAADRARMLQGDDLGAAILFLCELPPHVCVNQLVISPTWNRIYVDNIT